MDMHNHKYLPEDLFRRGLSKFLPQHDDPLLESRVLTDSDFPQISQLLVDYGKQKWSLLPRTFSVLWMLGISDRMDAFIAGGKTDDYLPYNEGNLPDIVQGATDRGQFLKLQKIVRLKRKDDLAELEEGGKHVQLGNADNYFFSLEPLGQGRFAEVDKVRSCQTLKIYARKRIFRGQTVFDDNARMAAFMKETRSLKSISHRHIVKLVGSYTDSTAVGLIMDPVADMDLQQFLLGCKPGPRHRIRGFFGCLITALSYIHKRGIRHKDIKPQNILIKGSQIMLADFGTSQICLDGHLTTQGEMKEGTPRYMAPEVTDRTKRNAASDIWSLGCVFLEMATVLLGRSLNEMYTFYLSEGTESNGSIYFNMPATKGWLAELPKSGLATDSSNILDWITWMLNEAPNDRPTAAQVRAQILDTKSEFYYICRNCASSNESGDTGGIEGPSLTSRPSDTDLNSNSTTEVLDKNNVDEGSRDVDATSIPINPPNIRSGQSTGLLPERPPMKISEASDTKQGDQVPSPKPMPRQDDDDSCSDFCPESYSPQPPHDSEDEVERELKPSDKLIEYPGWQKKLPYARRTKNRDRGYMELDVIYHPPFHHNDRYPRPKASLVPSYIYAGTNELSQNDIEKISDGSRNIFVYGRLMFPTVLHTIASQSLKGAYSRRQGRLRLTPEDWSDASSSVHRATKLMTPARIRGYSRRRLNNINCAVLRKDPAERGFSRGRSSNSHESSCSVIGFLICGLKRGALRYLDLLFESTESNLAEMRPTTTGHSEPESPLRRRTVDVEVAIDTGDIVTMEAQAYVLKNSHCNLPALRSWDANQFLYEPTFQRMFRDAPSSFQDEDQIAVQLGISCYFPGDYLCDIICRKNYRKLVDLLDQNWDPNAFSQIYGSPLHAAIAKGNEEMVEILLEQGANVNANIGPYGTPIIIAARTSRIGITKLLIASGANVLDTHSIHANALYQAIGNSNVTITRILLDNGAWLLEDWDEARDVAKENDDDDIILLLRQYDVREMHYQYCISRPDYRRATEINSLRPNMAVMLKGWMLRGNYKGRKGVEIVVAALNAGASISILEFLRNHFATFIPSLRTFILALTYGDMNGNRLDEVGF